MAMPERSARSLMAAASLVRLSYAGGLLLAPDWMRARRLAPNAPDGYARMTTRAFGAVHVNLSLLTLRSAVLNRDGRIALGLNIGCDLGDLVATLLEWREGDLPLAPAVGSAIVQSSGMAVWGSLLRSL